MRVGIFDSGVGGLTVLRAVAEAMPGLDLIYLGDTARVPYGTRSPRTVIRYSLGLGSFLAGQGVDALVVACNTATTHALPALQRAGAEAGVRVFGVIEPGVTAALRVHERGAIAVLGTEGTVRGGAYQRALVQARPGLEVVGRACPLFVPLAEEGWLSGEVPELVASRYLSDLVGQIDTAILGCTHYPLLKEVIQRALPGVRLVDSATETAAALLQALGPQPGQGARVFQVTDHVERFGQTGAIFLGQEPSPVEWVDLPPPAGAFASCCPEGRF
ncbi:MAG: glutamate racemase [Deltaproteobacteria bacterium]|nr:glutamate racemase [Deltaproteobacteria bacterium]